MFMFHEPIFLLYVSINYINCTYCLFVYVQTQGPQEATGRMDYIELSFFARIFPTQYMFCISTHPSPFCPHPPPPLFKSITQAGRIYSFVLPNH